ncbi:MAG: hypothetical protein A2806_03640 [Candidatus Terrybacteria bacterium RIFCSPHIGHO2_01_FULL_48_17]|uniref:SHS2 domain-containing protein n=1 Tax=Candidatus Terrybacteria bacterium RIFCSPHIGHO2_01_FULL_48_17 TaxID=1802362 RepID=A0A1G2PJ64_9BACT|nr:MAG: hypothetical protein A2806_03640 [Candidatus Terrybacteria bacterium RIFCSPHIGHO2_01_FULL_48_17]OHA53086.1 MAG: hypothetical protein A3A30_01820 [Candidatus Terrybacteria bacterium RIFCSPLOWO2_01_FULL_48_14]
MKVPNPLGLIGKKGHGYVGVDIGTSSVKVVELSGKPGNVRLETYGHILTPRYLEQVDHPLQLVSPRVLDTDVAGLIREICGEAKVKGKRASMSIPVFSSFFALLEIPKMGDRELAQAVPFQARQIVPVPISEVFLDWEIVGEQKRADLRDHTQDRFLVLIVAVPREVVDKFVRISKAAGIVLDELEVETFSLARALAPKGSGTVLLADVGARATSVSIIEDGTVRSSQVVDMGGGELTRAIASSVGVSIERSERIKIEQGITGSRDEGPSRALTTVLGGLLGEFEKATSNYFRKYGKKTERIVLAGATAQMPGMVEFIAERTGKSCELAYPFRDFSFPEILGPTLHEIGPSFSVATGLALRGLE